MTADDERHPTSPPIAAVVDTNVVLELVTDVDLARLDSDATNVAAQCFTHFVRPVVLSGWSLSSDPNEPDVQGDAADTWLLAQARTLGVPLITNEGLRQDGSEDARPQARRKLRHRGRDSGVTVQISRRVLPHPAGSRRADDSSLPRSLRARDAHCRRGGAKPSPHSSRVAGFANVYRMLLTGETSPHVPDLDVGWP